MGERRKLRAVDLFAGAGGMSSGLSAAGIEIIAAVERNADAAKSHRANHSGARLYEQDITVLSPETMMRELGLEPGELDILAGCPPCQGFTRLTEKHGRSDPRNLLIRDYLRFVRALRPRACMFENVPGLIKRGQQLFRELIYGFEQLGYTVTFEVLQLADYGVPQFRRRLVLLAGRDCTIDIPHPTHADPRRAERDGLRPWNTVHDAIARLPEPPRRSEVLKGKAVPSHEWHFARDVSPVVTARLRHALRTGGRRTLPEDLQLACHRKKCDGYNDVYGCMSWHEPSPTITSGCTNPSKGRFGHPGSPRPITPREAAALQTFPLTYKFCGGIESVSAQIGNALPVSFAKLLGSKVRRALEH